MQLKKAIETKFSFDWICYRSTPDEVLPREYFFKVREPIVRERRQREIEIKEAKKKAEVEI